MLKRTAIALVLASHVLSGMVAGAQQATGHLAETENAPLSMQDAAVWRQSLADDVEILRRLLVVQEQLVLLNRARSETGMNLMTLPVGLCTASPLHSLCVHLTATFGEEVSE